MSERPDKDPNVKQDIKTIKRTRGYRTGWMKILQHILITVAALAVLIYGASSLAVVKDINNENGSMIYHISAADRDRAFEDSVFFNSIFGRESDGVLRFVTIRSQLETDGAYDPEKVIDIERYNTRRAGAYASGGVTADYYLGDLIKWAKYGFEFVDVDVPADSVSGNYINKESDPDAYSYEDDEPSEWMGDIINRGVLVNRYRTVDGHTLEECVDNWDDYDILWNSLTECSSDLYTNYNDYLKYNDYYDMMQSNIRYLVVMGSGINTNIYTNTEIKKYDETSAEKMFKDYGRYIIYDLDRMTYDTDTAITESTFNQLMYDYKYAFSDDCRIYIAADMEMPADDALKSAKDGFVPAYLPNMNELIGIVVFAILAYMILLVICTVKEGRVTGEDGTRSIRFSEFDHTPIEIWLIILAAVIALFVGVPDMAASVYYDSFRTRALDIFNDIYIYVIFGVIVFVFDMIMLGLYYSLIRRIKGRHIWKQSLLYRFIQWCKRMLYGIYDNGNVILRSVIPYVALILINIFLFLVAESGSALSVWSILAVILIDVAAGVVIYKQVGDRDEIISVMKRIISGDIAQSTDADRYHGDNKELADCVNSIGGTIRGAVEKSMKDERMKTDLVANVSHDIRTPLTGIISYVDLIKREDIADPKIREYVNVIDEKSQRLKTLTDDLIEVSKVSSGNVELEMQKLDLTEIMGQAMAEFSDRLKKRRLSVVMKQDGLNNPHILADSRSLWRVMENLFVNVCKYAMMGSRVFIDISNTDTTAGQRVSFKLRNVSENPLPDDITELTERFIRGDESRTSDGSGLGLSIAKSLTELMGGTFTISSEADVFTVEIGFNSAI